MNTKDQTILKLVIVLIIQIVIVTLFGTNHHQLKLVRSFDNTSYNNRNNIKTIITGELKVMLNTVKPKIAFCDYNSYELYKQVAQDLNMDFKIITFKEGECTLEKFIKAYDDGASINEFE